MSIGNPGRGGSHACPERYRLPFAARVERHAVQEFAIACVRLPVVQHVVAHGIAVEQGDPAMAGVDAGAAPSDGMTFVVAK